MTVFKDVIMAYDNLEDLSYLDLEDSGEQYKEEI